MRTVWMAAALAAVTVALPATARAQAAPVATTTAARIAELMTPGDLLIASTARGFDQQFAQGLASNPQSAAFEQAHPGASAEAEAAARQVVLGALRAQLPSLRASTAAVIADNMDAVEQAGLLEFLSTPAGHKLVSLGDKIYSQQKLADAAKGGQLTQAQIAGAVDLSALNLLSPEETQAVAAFGQTPAGRKLAVVTPKLQQATADWSNALVTGQQAAVQQAVMGAIRAHVAAEKKGAGTPQ